MVEVPEFDTLETLLTVEDTDVDVLAVEFVLDVLVLFVVVELRADEEFDSPEAEFSVKFKSIP